MTVNQILAYDASGSQSLFVKCYEFSSSKDITRILGITKTISAKDSKSFSKEIAKYIDSKDQKRGKKDKDGKKDKEKNKGPSLMDKVRTAAGMSSRGGVGSSS